MDTGSFKRALRRVLRQDPDVILIGEMRDEETVHTALSAAETGHLVFSTVHTVDAAETVNRLIDFFPPHMHQQARAMIAGTLKGAVAQRLVPTADGRGRVACCEILRMTGRVRGHDHGPDADRPPARGHRRGHVLRDADVRPAPVRAPQGRPRRRWSRRSRPRRARTTSSSSSPPTASAARRWTTCSTPSRGATPSRRSAGRPAGRGGRASGRATSVGKVEDMPVDASCPVCRTADIVCGKWTLLLVRELAEGCSRFCELERSLVGISPRTLSLRLRALEEEGIVARSTFPAVPPRVEYALTDKGLRAHPDHRRDAHLRRALARGRVRRDARRRCGRRARAGRGVAPVTS